MKPEKPAKAAPAAKPPKAGKPSAPKPAKAGKPMTYEQHLDEVATLLTEKYDLEDDVAIALVMRAQADGYFSVHDDNPRICTLDRAHEDTRFVFKTYK